MIFSDEASRFQNRNRNASIGQISEISRYFIGGIDLTCYTADTVCGSNLIYLAVDAVQRFTHRLSSAKSHSDDYIVSLDLDSLPFAVLEEAAFVIYFLEPVTHILFYTV